MNVSAHKRSEGFSGFSRSFHGRCDGVTGQGDPVRDTVVTTNESNGASKSEALVAVSSALRQIK